MRSDCQRLTLSSLLTPTVDTMYCDDVLIACQKASQLSLCDTGSGGVQKSPVRSLGSIGGNADEVEISSTQCPAHSDIHSSTAISREVNKGEDRDRGRTWRRKRCQALGSPRYKSNNILNIPLIVMHCNA